MSAAGTYVYSSIYQLTAIGIISDGIRYSIRLTA